MALSNEVHERLFNSRYVDDTMICAKSLPESEFMLTTLKNELLKIGLEMHETKTKILTFQYALVSVDINGLLIQILPQDKGDRYVGRMVAASDSHGGIELSSRVRAAWANFINTDGGSRIVMVQFSSASSSLTQLYRLLFCLLFRYSE